jgi:hypothetical protein
MERITKARSFVLIAPPPSRSNSAKASFNSIKERIFLNF